MQKEDCFTLYRNMINCKYSLCYWRYKRDLTLLETNCEDAHLWQRVFEGSGTMEYLRAHIKQSNRPLLLDSMLGVLWGAVCVQDEIYMIGPVMGLEANLHDIIETMRRMVDDGIAQSGQDSSLEFRFRLTDAFKQLPTVPMSDFINDLAMLHCCMTGEHVGSSDVVYLHRQIQLPESERSTPVQQRDRHQTWMAEQAILRMVREGDLNYKDVLEHAANISRGVPVKSSDPLQSARFSSVTFITLCTRAAIEGGLTPEQAYSLGDSYIQQVADCHLPSEVLEINSRMYKDFVTRVHSCRTSPRLSPQIEACRDYIELHLDEPLSLEILAQHTGYSSYHLARKFKQETGTTVNTYIKYARIEHAKLLLLSTDESIRSIANQLQFCSVGYFAEVFQQVTGVKPQEWRKQRQK